jgi:putative redox protein
MNEVIATRWVGNMVFESSVDEFRIKMDSTEDYGGQHQGPRPKPLVLSALAGCTGMDVISILKKKKVQPDSFEIYIDGELMENHPKYYKTIRITYEFTGPQFQSDPTISEKINHAVRLSRDIYCAVSKMLKGSCEITDVIILHDS